MNTLVKLILIILIVYVVGRLFIRVLPRLIFWFISRRLQKSHPGLYDEIKRNKKQNKKTRSNNVIIKEPSKQKTSKSSNHDRGEYIDFEEL
ncbi:MAG: DUF4834 family protein [Bacteroidales bacterium]|nr:DUF4834 family protein [Bacteroidales bacterium]